MKLISKLTILLFILSSCANNASLPGGYNIQLLPGKPTQTEISDQKITYLVPKTILTSKGIYGLNFENRRWGTDTKQEKIRTNFAGQMLEIERRTDNGTAGSSRIYNVLVTRSEQADNIVLEPKFESTKQDGLVLPFPLPEFDLLSYLASAKVNYNFEINSEFSVESIRANFKRSLNQNSSNAYRVDLPNAKVLVEVKIDPYRNGSKVLLNAELYNFKPENNTIDVSRAIIELEKYISNIINS